MLDECERNNHTQPYQRYISFEEMLSMLAQLLLRMADYTLYISRFANDLPSLLAAACIAAVRQVSGVRRWSQYLVGLTSYTEAHVEPYMHVLTDYHYYHTIQPDYRGSPSVQTNQSLASPDSGFEESFTENTNLVVSDKVVTLETCNIITVQLQGPPPPHSSTLLPKEHINLKRPRFEDDSENLHPLKHAKVVSD
ncbi:GD13769 [Drosophila simulans]|nr:GD13769 [Drosophila simulans]